MKLARLGAVLMLVAAFSSALHATVAVPELDPGNAASGAMLLAGVVLVIRGRVKK